MHMKIKAGYIFGAFIPIALLTEFLWIPVGSGYLRPIHVLAPLVIVLFSSHIGKILLSPVFLLLAALLIVNLISSLISDTPSAAFTSYLLLLANFLLAISTALALASKRVSMEQIISLMVFCIILSAAWGLIQVGAFALAGANLALSEQQASQISAGFAPGFRTEANTLAKFFSTAFLLTFPAVFRLKKRPIFLVYSALLGAGLLISFTRSVLYTLPIILLLIFVWYQISGSGKFISRRPLILGIVFFSGSLVFTTYTVSFNEYASHKIENFFNAQEIQTGDSGSLRLEWQLALLNSFLGSMQGFFFGSGWGQIYYEYWGVMMQPGGADILIFSAYGGVLSGFLFFLLIITALYTTTGMIRRTTGDREALFFQGAMFAILGLTISGIINSSLNSPEYWIVIGMAIYSSYRYVTRKM
jgi:hypothetical protein